MKSTTVVKAVTDTQLQLWTHSKVNGLAKSLVFTESKSGSLCFKLKPRTSKSQADLKEESGMSGESLTGYTIKKQHELMRLQSSQFNGLVTSHEYTGGCTRVNPKTGVWTFTLKPARGVVVAEVTEESACEKLGISAEELAAFKAAKAAANDEYTPEEEAATLPDPKPAAVPVKRVGKPESKQVSLFNK